MIGYSFLLQLHNSLIPNQLLGTKYRFIKWMKNGGLQIQINTKQRKAIPAEILMMAYHIHKRNEQIRSPVPLNQKWLKSNGHSDWCFNEVILWLLENHDHNL